MKGSLFTLLLTAVVANMALIVTDSQISIADEFTPSHMCFKPEPPLFLASQRHRQRYQDDSDRYVLCMQEFIKDQQKSIKLHQTAAQNARSELEQFGHKPSRQ